MKNDELMDMTKERKRHLKRVINYHIVLLIMVAVLMISSVYTRSYAGIAFYGLASLFTWQSLDRSFSRKKEIEVIGSMLLKQKHFILKMLSKQGDL